MTIEISLVELQLHVAEALSGHGIGVEAFQVVPDSEGGWCIQLFNEASAQPSGDRLRAINLVETALGRRYKVHRLSRGGAYGG
jgi:hypothetical protein